MIPLLDIPAPYRWLITLGFIALIVVLSVTPDRGLAGDDVFSWLVTNTAPPLQKAMHVACYAGIAALWAWTLESVDPRWARLVLALVLTVSLGAILEWYQTTVPGRFGSIADIFLNAAGAVLGILITMALL